VPGPERIGHVPAADIQNKGRNAMNRYFRERCVNTGKSALCFALFMVCVVYPWVLGFTRIVVRIFGD